MSQQPRCPIAIVGMSCIFPGAGNLQQYWDNIQKGVCAISEVPEHRWDPVFFDPESKEVNRFYCRVGGFVDEFVDFDPLAYGLMPKSVDVAEPDQLLTLRVGIEALQDAGLWEKDFNRDKTGVVVGRGNYLGAGTLRLEQHVRLVQQTLQTLQDLIPDISQQQLEAVKGQIQEQLNNYGPDTAVGLIPNLVASRIANRLDLKGPAYTVDAACASALLAVEQSCRLLATRTADVMVCGGSHLTHDLTFWATFCQLGALSRTSTVRPFSADADGILAGEGVGMMVLKRLEDAQADGDRIYAVIQGVGSASDGNSASLLAPAVSGQMLALERAWHQTELSPDHIGLVEAHGTGTPAGDQAEMQTLGKFFGSEVPSDGERPGLGSVKSMIGHAMPAAGAAGLIKAALSVYHGVRPMTLQADNPSPLLEQTRFRLMNKTETWDTAPAKRIAAVNAFGFGGINAHVVISGCEQPQSGASAITANTNPSATTDLAINTAVARPKLLRLSANSQEQLQQQLAKVCESDDALATAQQLFTPEASYAWRLAIVNPSAKSLSMATKVVDKGNRWHGRSGIFFSCEPLLNQNVTEGNTEKAGKVAFLFPGVDSAFNPKLTDVAECFQRDLPDYCETLNPETDLLKVGLGLTGVNKFLNQLLRDLNVQPQAVSGHSIGEWSALAAASVLPQALMDEVNSKMDPDSLEVPNVAFLAVAAGVAQLQGHYEDLADVYVSHDNCPHQMIFCGAKEAITQLEARLREAGFMAQVLPIVSGFHSPLLADYAKPFVDFFNSVPLQPSQIPVWSAHSVTPFPEQVEGQRQLIVDHLLGTVRFRELIENLYAEGFRAFIQVGVGSLTGFVDDTLKKQPHFAIAANSDKRSGLEQLAYTLAGLWAEGVEPNCSAFVDGEAQSTKNQSQNESASKAKLLKTAIKPNSAATQRLKLGVPLLRLHKPLQLTNAASASQRHNPHALQADASNPLQQLFVNTLTDIQQAGEDVMNLWQQVGQQAAQPSARQPLSSRPAVQPPVSQPQFQPTTVAVTQRLDVQDNIPWVMDHAFYPQAPNWPVIADRHPVIPLTMELSLMRKAVESAVVGMKVIAMEKVRAFNWLIVEDPVDITIEVKHTQSDRAEVAIKGYAEAQVVLAAEFPASPAVAKITWQSERPAAITARELYDDNWMFHGPAYQSITQLGPIADNGIRGELTVSAGEGALLDNMGQLAGYWVMEEDDDCLAMPIGIDRISFFTPDPQVGEKLHCDVELATLDKTTCLSNLQLIDAHGQVSVKIDGWTTRRYNMDKRFWLHSKQVHKYLLSEELLANNLPGVVLFDDKYDTAITRDYMVRRYLNQDEMASYEKISPRRKRQWLNGRIAAKDAVRHHLWSQQGPFDLFPKELHISNLESGQPQVSAHITDTFKGGVHLSIAHKDKLAVAFASDKPVGIDIEKIEPRDDNILELVVGDDEQDVVATHQLDLRNAETFTRVWAAKEAVAKMRGTGLQGNPKSVKVQAIDGQRIQVEGCWVNTTKYQDYIIGWTEV